MSPEKCVLFCSRQKDAAVFEAFNHGYLNDGVMGPTSKEVAGTVSTFVDLFCSQYAVNGADTAAGVPGVLIGRYDGDHYVSTLCITVLR